MTAGGAMIHSKEAHFQRLLELRVHRDRGVTGMGVWGARLCLPPRDESERKHRRGEQRYRDRRSNARHYVPLYKAGGYNLRVRYLPINSENK